METNKLLQSLAGGFGTVQTRRGASRRLFPGPAMGRPLVRSPRLGSLTVSLLFGLLLVANAVLAATTTDPLEGRRVIPRGNVLISSLVGFRDHSSEVFTTESLPQLLNATPSASDPSVGIIDTTPVGPDAPDAATCLGSVAHPYIVRAARLFNLDHDVLAEVRLNPANGSAFLAPDCTPASDGALNMLLSVLGPPGADGEFPVFTEFAFSLPAPGTLQVTAADLDYDGFDEIIVLGGQTLRIFYAASPSDPSQGLVAGPVYTFINDEQAPLNEPGVGDFNGDGLLEIAWVGGLRGTASSQIDFVTVCPGQGIAGKQSGGASLCGSDARFAIVPNPIVALFAGHTVVQGGSAISLPDTANNTTENWCLHAQGDQTVRRPAALAMGNFVDNGVNGRGGPIEEIAVFYLAGGNNCDARVALYEYVYPAQNNAFWAKNTFAQEHLNGNVAMGASYSQTVLLGVTAHLDPFKLTEQAVFALSYYPGGTWYRWPPFVLHVPEGGGGPVLTSGQVETIAPTFNGFYMGLAVAPLSSSSVVTPGAACADLAQAAAGQCPYRPQVTLTFARFDDDTSFFQGALEYVPNADFSLQKVAEVQFDATFAYPDDGLPPYPLDGVNRLSAVDFGGDTLRLQAPFQTTGSGHLQPQFVLQAPPVHMDYVTPEGGRGTQAAMLNLSAAAEFAATLDFAGAGLAEVTPIAGWSASGTGDADDLVAFPKVTALSTDADILAPLGMLFEYGIKPSLGSFAPAQADLSGATASLLDDLVVFSSAETVQFHYPVTGGIACPATITVPNLGAVLPCAFDAAIGGCLCKAVGSSPICPAVTTPALTCNNISGGPCCTITGSQLNFTVSVPDPESVVLQAVEGGTLEWYQPDHQPGQLLSYPSTVALAQARHPDMDLLTRGDTDELTTGTSGAGSAGTSVWAAGAGDKTLGSDLVHSFDTVLSALSGSADVEDLYVLVSETVAYNASDVIGTPFAFEIGLDALSGLQVVSTGAGFLDQASYGYFFTPFIATAGSADSLQSPGTPSCPDGSDCALAASGVPTAGFATDPTDFEGSWWADSDYTSYIDIALNQPGKWKQISAANALDTDLQCRGDANTCFAVRAPSPSGNATTASDVLDNPFYYTRGLKVTVGTADGPQRISAEPGETVYLTANVYNYSISSLKTLNTASATDVYVQFYRQLVSVNNGEYSYLGLSEAVGDPVPVLGKDGSTFLRPFNVGSNAEHDNMGSATVSFTTSAQDADTYWFFWVVAWGQYQDDGTLVPELPGHGLDASFDPTKLYFRPTGVPLETSVLADGSSASFSNNVGLNNQIFHIKPVASLSAPPPVPGPAPEPPTLGIEDLVLRPARLGLHDETVVSAAVWSHGEDTEAVTVLMKDEDANGNIRLFDVELLPRVPADGDHAVRATYRPRSCGVHRISLEASAKDREPTALDDELLVVCPDINGDGCVDVRDTAALYYAIARGRTDPSMDLNGDHVVNRADARKVSRYYSNPHGRPCNTGRKPHHGGPPHHADDHRPWDRRPRRHG